MHKNCNQDTAETYSHICYYISDYSTWQCTHFIFARFTFPAKTATGLTSDRAQAACPPQPRSIPAEMTRCSAAMSASAVSPLCQIQRIIRSAAKTSTQLGSAPTLLLNMTFAMQVQQL